MPYGFLDMYSGYFKHVTYTENEINELGSDAEFCSPQERRAKRIKHENEKWDEEHYMCDSILLRCLQNVDKIKIGLTMLTTNTFKNFLPGEIPTRLEAGVSNTRKRKTPRCSACPERNVRTGVSQSPLQTLRSDIYRPPDPTANTRSLSDTNHSSFLVCL